METCKVFKFSSFFRLIQGIFYSERHLPNEVMIATPGSVAFFLSDFPVRLPTELIGATPARNYLYHGM